jgi:hypothetical protein
VGDIEDAERLVRKRRRRPGAGLVLLATALTAVAVVALIAAIVAAAVITMPGR